MSKLLIAALLAVFSTSVLAEWTRVGYGDGTTAYADPSNIRKSGDKVKMWNLFDNTVAEINKNPSMSYLSQVSQAEYDCKEETIRALTFNWYSKNMGAGRVVHTTGAIHEEPRPIPPGSMVEGIFKVACGK